VVKVAMVIMTQKGGVRAGSHLKPVCNNVAAAVFDKLFPKKAPVFPTGMSGVTGWGALLTPGSGRCGMESFIFLNVPDS
jgi:hypothetical protein